MPKTFVIQKPTHRFFDRSGALLAVGQKRGDLLVLNRLDTCQKVTEKTWAVGLCTDDLTGYGQGVQADRLRYRAAMQSAWRFMFGADVPAPARCEVV